MRPCEQVRLIIYGLMSSPILEGPAGWWKDEHAPLRHMIAERKSKKLNLHLSQNRVRLYSCCCFSAMMETILLYTTVQCVPCRQKVKRQGGRRFSEPSEAVVLLSILLSGVPVDIV